MSSKKNWGAFEVADLVTYDYTFLCGACGEVIKFPTTHKLSCKIHYACGSECAPKSCARCVCDACGKCVTDNAFIPSCGCCYHETCLRSVGADDSFRKCSWCTDSPHTRTMSDAVVPTGVGGTGWSIFSNVFGVTDSQQPKITKKIATLTEEKLNRLSARGWKPDDYISKPAYGVDTFSTSGITLHKLFEAGFTTRHISKLGFSLEQFLYCYARQGEVSTKDLKEFVFLVNVSFTELIRAVIGIFNVKVASEALEYLKTNMGFAIVELVKLPNTTTEIMLEHFTIEVWTSVYGKKEVGRHLQV